jgi:hypothetical protein
MGLSQQAVAVYNIKTDGTITQQVDTGWNALVSSTRNGAGDYTLVFQNALSALEDAISVQVQSKSAGVTATALINATATKLDVATFGTDSKTAADQNFQVIIFRIKN